MQPKQDTLIPGKDDNTSENFGPHEDEESKLEEQDIEEDHRNLLGKSLDTRSHVRDGLLGHTLQDRLFISKLLLSLREVRFSKQEFPAGKLISNKKYHYQGSQNNNLFYLFIDQLDYALVIYFAEFKTTKGVDRFFSNLLMAPFTEKLSYQNVDEWIEKLSDILQGIPNNKQINHKFEL